MRNANAKARNFRKKEENEAEPTFPEIVSGRNFQKSRVIMSLGTIYWRDWLWIT